MKNNSFEYLRKDMVKNQIVSRDIIDKKTINAMETVKREKFFPENFKDKAYLDGPFPIGHGQTISQPYIVALMTQLCKGSKNETILEIGTGSGYQTAILSLIFGHVYTVELINDLGVNAKKILSEQNFNNISFKIDDGYKGWKENGPYDKIILTAAPKEIPQSLIKQLKDKGVLIAPEGVDIQKLVKIEKSCGILNREIISYVRFVPMVKSEK